jgi:hypothetical protein
LLILVDMVRYDEGLQQGFHTCASPTKSRDNGIRVQNRSITVVYGFGFVNRAQLDNGTGTRSLCRQPHALRRSMPTGESHRNRDGRRRGRIVAGEHGLGD